MPTVYSPGEPRLSTNLSFLAPLQDDIHAVEGMMLAQMEGHHADLRNALDLILKSGGKRIRTSLTLLSGRTFGADPHRLKTLAAAIELLHTATLVHDDLIDGSLLRRGLPTLNSQWSPGATVLTGDFLFARAAVLAAETESIPVIRQFAHVLGVIVNGEITQMFASRCKASRDDYYERIYAKTASLFETSTWSAAVIGGADTPAVEAMRNYGYQIGMAFQIIDDILDFTSDAAQMGKPVGSDLRQGLVTLPCLYYLEDHTNDHDVQPLFQGRCLSDDQLSRVVTSIRESHAIERSYQEAERFVHLGLESLRSVPPSSERSALEELADYIVARKL